MTFAISTTLNNATVIAKIPIPVLVKLSWQFLSIWNLFPQYVTERVKVASVDPSRCMATTSDNYLLNLKDTCNPKPGDYIMGTYDTKVKERRKPFIQ
jgi:hypothetical protein